jgi:hypothetical protein
MQIAVIGPGQATPGECGAAYAAGRIIAGNGAVLVCGGLGGVMEAACRGARDAGGTTVGILPGTEAGNPYLNITSVPASAMHGTSLWSSQPTW